MSNRIKGKYILRFHGLVFNWTLSIYVTTFHYMKQCFMLIFNTVEPVMLIIVQMQTFCTFQVTKSMLLLKKLHPFSSYQQFNYIIQSRHHGCITNFFGAILVLIIKSNQIKSRYSRPAASRYKKQPPVTLSKITPKILEHLLH